MSSITKSSRVSINQLCPFRVTKFLPAFLIDVITPPTIFVLTWSFIKATLPPYVPHPLQMSHIL